MNLQSHILGCMLGTALGDAVGLPREGLSRRRARRMYGNPPLEPSLICGRGFCSDDTEHLLMAGWALARSGLEATEFKRLFAIELKKWLLAVPAGVGLATLKACCKLIVGIGPDRSGVFSAGNGPAMRSALLGVCANDDEHLRQLVRASTRITHTDPRAEEGALLVAQAARFNTSNSNHEPSLFLQTAALSVQGPELRQSLGAVAEALVSGKTCREFADSQGWTRGISGYVNQTVPAALYCWARWPNDFRQCVESAVLLGGDADTVGAIAGAISGANLGASAIPPTWLDRFAEWPRTIEWMTRLADSLTLAVETQTPTSPPPMRWVLTIPRNLAFAAVVITHALRRLLPPY